MEIDGAFGEGGGQILRMSFALAGCRWYAKLRDVEQATIPSLRVTQIRMGRPKPGLRPQHQACLAIFEHLFKLPIQDNTVGSTCVSVDFPAHVTRIARLDGSMNFGTKTAASITLMIQLALPCLAQLATCSFAHDGKSNSDTVALATPVLRVCFSGGTMVSFSPPITFVQHVLLPTLKQYCEIESELRIIQHGFYPRGGGKVELSVCTTNGSTFSPFLKSKLGQPIHLDCHIVVGWLWGTGAEERKSFEETVRTQINIRLANNFPTSSSKIMRVTEIDADHQVVYSANKKKEQSQSNDFPAYFSILFVVRTTTDCFLSGNASVLEPRKASKASIQNVAQRAVENLTQTIAAGSCTDEHLADQLIVFMALCKSTCEVTIPSSKYFSSNHLESGIYVASKMTGVSFQTQTIQQSIQGEMAILVSEAISAAENRCVQVDGEGNLVVECRLLRSIPTCNFTDATTPSRSVTCTPSAGTLGDISSTCDTSAPIADNIQQAPFADNTQQAPFADNTQQAPFAENTIFAGESSS